MNELLTQFGIDWKLLIAQIVNFALLLTLLRIFAYKPIIKMLALRRKKIEQGMAASAEAQRTLAETQEREKQIILNADRKAFEIITIAEQKAEIQAGQILDGARQKSEQVIMQGRKHLDEERLSMSVEFQSEAEGLMRMGLIKVIGKLEPKERDTMLIQEALHELKIVSHQA